MKPDLAAAANTLADLLRQENAALQRLDFVAAMALVPAKEAALMAVVRSPAPAQGHARDPALLALGRTISELIAANRALLGRAINVQTRIVGIIVSAAPLPAAGEYVASGVRRLPRRAPAMALLSRA